MGVSCIIRWGRSFRWCYPACRYSAVTPHAETTMKLSILTIQSLLSFLLGVRTFDEDPLGFATVGSAPFCQGATIHGSNAKDIVSAQRIGSNCARVRIPWLVVQRDPVLRSDFCQTDPPEALRRRCDHPNTGAPGAASVQRACWEREVKGRLQFVEVDDLIYSVVDPKFHVVAVIGEGTLWSLPVIEDNISSERIVRPLDPNIDGIDCYLHNLYVYARVVVMRYKSAIKHWQLENALNAAAMHSKYYGWRSRSVDFAPLISLTVHAAGHMGRLMCGILKASGTECCEP